MAATAAKAFEHGHIVKTHGVRGGKARIDGTRICVADLVHLLKRGFTPDQMRGHYSDRRLTLAEVHSALAYYYDNADEIEADFASEERFHGEADRRWQDLAIRHGGQPPENPTAEERAIPRAILCPPKP